jgi:glycine/D-amino acid oxidase-like deaminating enzyme
VAFDVVIVGGGIMGASTAYHLLRADPALSVVVVERDPSYRLASTTLCEGNVRTQFNLEENVRISQYAMAVLETFADEMETASYRPDPAPRREGNLFFVDAAGEAAARAGLATQRSLGCAVEWLDAAAIAAEFPAFRTEGLVGGTLGRGDGRVDPGAMLRGYRLKAIELGATFVAAEVLGIDVVAERVRGVVTSDEPIVANVAVVAAGAWAPGLVAPLGVVLPVSAVMRTVYIVASSVPTAGLPAAFLPSGAYAIPIGDHTWESAWSLESDPVGFDFTPAPRSRFEEAVWPELVRHLPAFDALRVESAWAGLYDENHLDGNAILGEWPGIAGLHLAVGFSGHGFQQAPAVGRYLAEEIRGDRHVLDLSRLGPQRVIAGSPLSEYEARLI